MNIVTQDFRDYFSKKLDEISKSESVKGVACILVAFHNDDTSQSSAIATGYLSEGEVYHSFSKATSKLCLDMKNQIVQQMADSGENTQ